MIRTIALGKYLSVQGVFVRMLDNGMIVIRDGEKTFVGTPVPAHAKDNPRPALRERPAG